jgi:hypothetical protein
VTICGEVVMYGCSGARIMVLLNLDAPFRSGSVSIGVCPSQRATCGERFEDQYLGAYLCATGLVERMHRRRVLVVDTPASLVITNRQQPAPFAPDAVRSCGADVALTAV